MNPVERQLVVEVVYALPHEQVLLTIRLPSGSTIRDALACSGIVQRFPDVDFATCAVGVFGKACSLGTVLADGDRVELYRSLYEAPKQARRARAQKGRTGRTER